MAFIAPLDRRYEKPPATPLGKNWIPKGAVPYKVQDGDSFVSLTKYFELPSVKDFIYYNFRTDDPREINWYLRERVGCDKTTADRKNRVFSSSARPGVIYIPPKSYSRNTLVGEELLNYSWIGTGLIVSGAVGFGYEYGKFVLFHALGAARLTYVPLILTIRFQTAQVGARMGIQLALVGLTGVLDPTPLHGYTFREKSMRFKSKSMVHGHGGVYRLLAGAEARLKLNIAELKRKIRDIGTGAKIATITDDMSMYMVALEAFYRHQMERPGMLIGEQDVRDALRALGIRSATRGKMELHIHSDYLVGGEIGFSARRGECSLVG